VRLSCDVSNLRHKSGELIMATMVDEYWGQGGTYLLDSKTGKRKLIERTEPAQPSQPDEVLSNVAAEPQTPDPGED
jgi:hypothetical protein